MDGADQPDGTVSSTLPFAIPPAAAVYVNVIVLPVDDVPTELVSELIVPVPSAALTVIAGELPAVSVPPLVALSRMFHVCAPVELVAVAPGPLLAFEP